MSTAFPAERVLVDQTEIGVYLGVALSRVSMWYARRTQGFPDPVACKYVMVGGGRRGAPLWDYAEVFRWYLAFDTSKLRRSARKETG